MNGRLVVLACWIGGCSGGGGAPPPPTTVAPATTTAPPPTTQAPPPSTAASIDPFVADIWLLRADPNDDADPGRRVVVISTADTEGQRPEGLAPMGSATDHDDTWTFYRLPGTTTAPLSRVTVIGAGSTCEARVTSAARARIGSDTRDEEEVADIEAWVLDFEGCPDGDFAAGPQPVTMNALSFEDAATFAPASPEVVAAIGDALAGPLRSHALAGTDALVVGSADRLCLFAHGRNDCGSTSVPYAEVRVGPTTFLLLHDEENGDYSAPLDAALP